MGDDTKITQAEFPKLDNRAWTTPNQTNSQYNPKDATAFYEERGAFQGMLRRTTGAQLVENTSVNEMYIIRLLESILGQLKAQTAILNHRAETMIEAEDL